MTDVLCDCVMNGGARQILPKINTATAYWNWLLQQPALPWEQANPSANLKRAQPC